MDFRGKETKPGPREKESVKTLLQSLDSDLEILITTVDGYLKEVSRSIQYSNYSQVYTEASLINGTIKDLLTKATESKLYSFEKALQECYSLHFEKSFNDLKSKKTRWDNVNAGKHVEPKHVESGTENPEIDLPYEAFEQLTKFGDKAEAFGECYRSKLSKYLPKD